MPVPPVIQMYRYVMGSGGGLGNLLKASEEFQQTRDWVRYPTNSQTPTVNDDSRPDPNGGTTADQIGLTANTSARLQQTVTLSASTEYTFSVYARAVSGTVDFRMRNVTLKDAEVKTATTTGPDGGGFTRFTYTFTTTTAGSYELALQNDTNATAKDVIFWGAMLNQGGTALDYEYSAPTTGGSAPAPAYAGFGDAFGGVTAYYSLRQFTEAETLNAIRVRRSSDDTEQDIGFDANGDLDSTALTTFVNEEYTLADEDFSSSTGWTLGTGVSITGGVMTANTSGTVVSYKNFGDTGAQQVRVTFTVSNYVSGSVRYMNFAVSTTGTSRSANGTYTEVLTLQEGGNANHGLQMLSNFVGDIDDFEVVQITADGAVTTFYDQTGNGNNATNATASEQPKIVSGGSVETLGSDVTPVRQGVTTTLDISGVESSVTGAFTLVTRFYLRSQSDSDCIFGGRGLTAGAGLCASYLSGAWRFEVVTTTGTRAIVVVSDSNTPINNWYNVIFTWDGTTDSNAVKVYLNTSSNIFTATANGTVINYDASYPMSIFNADRNSFDGGLATWTIFDSQVTDIDGLFTAITP